MATVYDIIKGINQAAANAYDGSHDASLQADGKARDAGLTRQDGHYINDRRVMDGFKVSIHGPILRVNYQAEVRIKDVQKNDFEDQIASHLEDIVKFLKKEYKNLTNEALTLTADGPCSMMLQNMSKIRTWVQASKVYTVGNMKDIVPVGEPSQDRLEDNLRFNSKKIL